MSNCTPNDYKGSLRPIWCPGCGDFGVLQALYKAFAAIGRPPHEIALMSGIGCSSRIPGYLSTYGFNSVHGRALPMAQGLKQSRPELMVVAASGDGDGFSIGGGHVAHAVRRNQDITWVVMDNQIYGLTKGQLSPTSAKGRITATSYYGSIEQPFNPLTALLAYGCGFVAQSTPADLPGLTAMIEEAIRYPGFSFVNVRSPCVTFGEPGQMIKEQRKEMVQLSEIGHDSSDRLAAYDLAEAYCQALHCGVFYRNPNPPSNYNQLIDEQLTELNEPNADVLASFAVN